MDIANIYLTQDEHKAIVRQINTLGLGNKNELKELNYPGFEMYLVQLAYLIYSRPPEDLHLKPFHASIQKLIDHFHHVTAC